MVNKKQKQKRLKVMPIKKGYRVTIMADSFILTEDEADRLAFLLLAAFKEKYYAAELSISKS